MSNYESCIQRFEIDYANSPTSLSERDADDRRVDPRLNAGADEYSHDWV